MENIESFAKEPPETVVYVYKIWQSKFDEMKTVVDLFVEDNVNVVQHIKEVSVGQRIFVIFVI